MKLRRWRARSALISGSSVGPSTPWFHDRLCDSPSRLSSPLAVLCFSSYETRSVSGEPVVARHEVDRRGRLAGRRLVQVGAAREPVAELAERRRLAAPQVADRVAVPAVPLRPARREVTDLVPAVAHVPRLGDQLDLRDDGVLLHQVEERREPVDLVQLAGQGRGEVEAEAVDVHLDVPVAEAVHDQLQHVRVAHVHAVAGAGEVEVVAGIAVDEAVVGRIVDAPHRQRRTEVVALRRVVVDHVEDHLDAGAVERLHHRLELLCLADDDPVRVAVVRGEERDRVVAPVVPQPELTKPVVMDEVVHRHQLDCGDAEVHEVLDDGRMGDRRVGAAQLVGHARVLHRETTHVRFVDDGLVHRPARRPVVAPVEVGVADRGERHVGGAVAEVGAVGIVELVPEAGRGPVDLSLDRLGVRVDEELRRVAPQPGARVPRAVHPPSVVLTGSDLGEVHVPDVAVDLVDVDPDLVVATVAGRVAEQAQLDPLGDRREQGEVGAGPVVGGAERRRLADPGARFPGGRAGALGRSGGRRHPPILHRARRGRRERTAIARSGVAR